LEVLCAGSFMIDIVAPHLPAITPPGGLIYAPEGISVNVGGHAANASIDLAGLGQVGVAAAGCVGDDMFGRFIEEALRRAGVEPRQQVHASAGTAKNIALTVEGEDRRFIAELAANTLLDPDHVIRLLRERPKVLYLGTVGGLRLVDRSLPRVMGEAHAAGAVTFVDVIPPTEPDWDHLTSALGQIDVLHLNGHEARLVTGLDSPVEAASKLRGMGADTVIVTLGPRGLVALRGGARIVMPGFRVREVDTTGAGDALCAGVIHSLMGEPDPARVGVDAFLRALLEGQAAGAACVTSPGATTAVTSANVRRLVAEQGGAVLEATTLSL
jgi:sugar/nucleoside kinase (ribokinase family)